MVKKGKSVKKASHEPATTGVELQKLTATAKRALTGGQKAKREKATALIALIARRKSEILENFYDIGEALLELKEKRLFLALNHSSFEDMLKERTTIGHAQAYELMKLVQMVPRKIAMEMGSAKSAALTEWVAVTETKETVAELVKSNAVIGGKPVKKASSRDIANAVKEQRAAQAKGSKDPKVRARAKKLLGYVHTVKAMLAKVGVPDAKIEHNSETITIRLTIDQAKKVNLDGLKAAPRKKG